MKLKPEKLKPILLDKIWLPPEGYCFAKLFAATYSLEERVLGELAFHFLPSQCRSSIQLSTSPGELKATLLKDLDGNLKILFDRSALKVGTDYEKSRYGIFARFLQEKVPSKYRKGLCLFHPKVFWAIFKNESDSKWNRARLIIGSQNLAIGGDCLEAALVWEFGPEASAKTASDKRVRALLDSLIQSCDGWTDKGWLNELHKLTSKLKIQSGPSTSFEVVINNPHNGNGIREIIPNLQQDAKEILVISPFLNKTTIRELEKSTAPDCKISIITRAQTLNELIPYPLPTKNPYPKTRFGPQEALGLPLDRPLHAKMICIHGRKGSKLILGSSNFSQGGWGRNHEVNAQVEISEKIEEMTGLWDRLKSLNQDGLASAPGETPLPEKLLVEEIHNWINQWDIRWEKKVRPNQRVDRLPLRVITVQAPEAIKVELGKTKLTVLCGTLKTKSISVLPESCKLELPLSALTLASEMNPLIEIKFGSVKLWLLPDYLKFPFIKQFEQIAFEDLILSLRHLMRSSSTPRLKTNSKQNVNDHRNHPIHHEVNLERFVLSIFRESSNSENSNKYTETSLRLKNLLARVNHRKLGPEETMLLESIRAIEKVLKKRRVS